MKIGRNVSTQASFKNSKIERIPGHVLREITYDEQHSLSALQKYNLTLNKERNVSHCLADTPNRGHMKM